MSNGKGGVGAVTAVYALVHMAVDLSCAFLVFAYVSGGERWYLWLLIYNFCAFALQMPIGAAADRLDRNSCVAAGGCAGVLAGLLLGSVGFPAAAAVAAHECGHAVQHATAYAPLRMRSALVPVVSFASNIMTWVLLGGMLLINTFPQLMLFGIILFASTTLFSFITLPVEINASQRALVWLSNAGITNVYTHDKAEDALRSAAYTYVVAALGSLATLLYYIMIFLGGRSRD